MPASIRVASVLSLSAAMFPAALIGQSPAEVFSHMLAEQDRRAARIENYTVAQEVMGTTVTMYLVKDASGPHVVFRVRDMIVPGMDASNFRAAEDMSADLWSELPALTDQARYVGRESVDGHAVHVVEVPDMSKAAAFQTASGGQFEARKGTFYVDGALWVPRRLVFEGRMTTEQKTADVTMTMDLQDYRDVEGMLHPFRSTVRIVGMVDPEMQAQIREMKKQMETMPEAQRKMMEQMMQGQMGQMMNMVGDDGSMTFTSAVQEVRVNAGPPR